MASSTLKYNGWKLHGSVINHNHLTLPSSYTELLIVCNSNRSNTDVVNADLCSFVVPMILLESTIYKQFLCGSADTGANRVFVVRVRKNDLYLEDSRFNGIDYASSTRVNVYYK